MSETNTSSHENDFTVEKNYVAELINLIREEKDDKVLADEILNYHENDIAAIYSELTTEEHERLYNVLGPKQFSEIFAYVDDANEYLNEIPPDIAAKVLNNMDSDDAKDILDEVDDEVEQKILPLMDKESTDDIQLLRSYEEDEIGSKMTTNFISIHNTNTIKQAMKSLVQQAGDNDNISTIYVLDQDDKYYGAIALRDLIVARENTSLISLVSTSYPYVNDHELIQDCLERIKDYTEDSIPILNSDGFLLGVITSQDIVEVVDEEFGEDYVKFAGITEEADLNEGIFSGIRKRLPWLLILLALGLGVSFVVGFFENVVASLAIVVCFQSLVLDMAGNVGTQSLAVTIRVLTKEDLTIKDKFSFISKELRIGIMNGLLLGILSFVAVGLYIFLSNGDMYTLMQSYQISACVGFSLFIAMLISSFVGTIIPMIFHKIGVDPAAASGPLITTVNDLVAIVTYYGLAWALLINVLGVGT